RLALCLLWALLAPVFLGAGARPPAAGPSFGLRGARAATIVRRVEAGALEVDGDRVEDTLDGLRPADLALLGRRLADPLEQLENVSVRTTVLVDRHVLTVAAGLAGTA